MLNYMNEGGIIMWVIAAMSLGALAVTIERLLFFRKASANTPEELEKRIADSLEIGGASAALQLASSFDCSLNRIFCDVLSNWEANGDDIKMLADGRIRRELYRWERHLFILEMIGRLAPMLGLLGTVLGMVEMFGTLHLGGPISAEAVTGGIWKALYTTVAGLAVAIPTVFVCGLLNARIGREEEKMQRGADYAALLHEKYVGHETKKK